LANKNGGSNEVEEVIAKDKFLVTAAIAEIGFDGECQKIVAHKASTETYNRWVRHWPLRGTSNAVIKALLVGIITTICICQEESIDLPTLESLCQIDPIV
jgi:hypothetical protein